MKFYIERASRQHRNQPPCVAATSVTVPTSQRILRARPGIHPPSYEQWVIELDSLEDLVALMNEVSKRLIVSPSQGMAEPDLAIAGTITIYDSYVE